MSLPLAECSEFRQAMRARPPRGLHATAALLLAAVAAAVAWAELTEANLVARGDGRVRPLTPPQKVSLAGRSEVLSASTGGRVVSVHYAEGQVVRAGDVLVRLETERVDNEIEQRKRAVATAEAELARLAALRELAAEQDRAARAKLEAELEQAGRELRQAENRQVLELRRAEVDHKAAEEELTRATRISAKGAGSAPEVAAARTKLAEAVERLSKAALPVDTGRARVCRAALALAAREAAVRQEEFALKEDAKRGEIATARLALAALELERRSAELVAPVGGVVTTPAVKPGDLLAPGKPVVEIAEREGLRFEAVFAPGEVGELRVGMEARITLDAYDYQRYGVVRGTVESISPDSVVPDGGQTPAYVVRVAIDGDRIGTGEWSAPIKLGMTGRVEVVTGRESLLRILGKKIRHTISLR